MLFAFPLAKGRELSEKQSDTNETLLQCPCRDPKEGLFLRSESMLND